jgi:tRNA(Ile)-lysidine synthase
MFIFDENNFHFYHPRKMLGKIRKFIDENHLLLDNDRPVIVGVSGGTDSVVLLNILQKLGYKCIIAHCNFHLRNEESDSDEMFVRSLSETSKTPIYITDFETNKYASANNISIEMAARDLRYLWFENLCRENDAQAIAVGHHLDDNIETMLLNLARGTGLKGLTGMPVRNGLVVRPLLDTSRNKITQYLIENNLKYVEDGSNSSTDYVRNKIRHQLIPLMEEINPAFRQTMKKTRENLQDTYHIFQTEINRIKNEIVSSSGNKTSVNINKIQQYAVKETVLYEILKEYHFHPDQIRQITESLDTTAGKMFYSPTHALLRDRESLIIQLLDNTTINTVTENGEKPTTHLLMRTFDKDNDFEYSKNQHVVHLDADKISLPLTQRKWQPADFFFPLGMKNKKKLSDFLIDEKIDRFEKENVQVLLSGNKIVWVIGLRMDERFKVTAVTRRILEIAKSE